MFIQCSGGVTTCKLKSHVRNRSMATEREKNNFGNIFGRFARGSHCLDKGVCYSCKFTFVLRQPEPHRRLVRSTMNITNLKLFKNAKNGKMYPVWVTYLFCLHKSFV